MEAAACGTPSVAIAGGGLRESIVDGETGLLADDAAGLATAAHRLAGSDDELRSGWARPRWRGRATFTWERTARETLDGARGRRAPARPERRARSRDALARSTPLAPAAGRGGDGRNAHALVFTVVFARLLGADGYGSLAALLSAFIILMVPGSALQIAVAREIELAVGEATTRPRRSIRRWLKRLLVLSVAVTVASVLLRDPIASDPRRRRPGRRRRCCLPACLWLMVSVERGALGLPPLQAVAGRCSARPRAARFGLVLVGRGLGVTGASRHAALAGRDGSGSWSAQHAAARRAPERRPRPRLRPGRPGRRAPCSR